jgi:hypothetical protein
MKSTSSKNELYIQIYTYIQCFKSQYIILNSGKDFRSNNTIKSTQTSRLGYLNSQVNSSVNQSYLITSKLWKP